ncbi:competence/damage-inducible protein cinA [Caldanaerobius fijiensis DSM 17918]|uniref:Putative competence-damage inducible protein n=1 Tax=Caldanaerobius fijiensis DSM 17918 TaxID=1121256 RepID=A0A1M4YBK0_9THEO|nr:competence/damage-inducible protein A [Caldanaerobius fijiensis]SHF03117.1 competence/damage-inducible protein cinA [Caldanaerobius fijiensis DSM 17918]
MKCEIISVGTELLLGQIANTDAQYISQELAPIGIDVYFHTAVGDNSERLKECLRIAWNRSDIIITSGGLGPTLDDLTKETIADFLGLKMVEYQEAYEHLQRYFKGKKITQNNYRQAYFPEGSILLPNNNGTAMGAILEKCNKIIIILPGPPNELVPMFKESVIPYLIAKSGYMIKSRVLRIFGIGESQVEDMIKEIIINQTNPTIAPLAKEGEVTLRITAKGKEEAIIDKMIQDMEEHIRDILGDYIYGIDDDSLESIVGQLLIKKGITISVAESCTGGLIAHKLTNIPGISSVFKLGTVVYSNEAKVDVLNVNSEVLKEKGAVSEETAIQMAQRIRQIGKTDLGLSVTGIAGPDGGTAEKPVGLVYIALAEDKNVICNKYNFNGNRLKNKNLASMYALDMVRRYLIK